MIIELSKAKVTIKDELTWGDTEKIQAVIMQGAKVKGNAKSSENVDFDFDTSTMLEAKYVALECAIVKIEEGNAEIAWSREWMNNLSRSDGEKLYKAVDGLSKN